MKRKKALQPPYLDLTLTNIEDEAWKPIIGYEDYYEVSDHGRIKSIEREVPHPNKGSQLIPEKILKQKIHVNIFTLKKGKPTVDLSVALSKMGKMKYHNVRRLVYAAFVNPSIDFSRDRLVIINMDGDGRNNRLDNLAAVTESQKSMRMVKRGRTNDFLKHADRSCWDKRTSRWSAVKQISISGNKVIARYESISKASKATGFDEKGISATAHGKYSQWGGFKWTFEKKRKKLTRNQEKVRNR
jgi:hypothetical protein